MELFWTVIFGAVVVESIVNIVKNIDDKNKDWRYWAALALGLIAGVFIGWNWDIDFFEIAGIGEGKILFAGSILTGLMMSRGANFVNDLWARLLAYKQEP